jgi:hypothetical protein
MSPLFKGILRLCSSIAILLLILLAAWYMFHHNLQEATFCLVLVILCKVMDRSFA